MSNNKRLAVIAVAASAIAGGALVHQNETYPNYVVEKHGNGYSVFENVKGKKGKAVGYDLDESQVAYFKK